MEQLEKLEGAVENIVYRNENNDYTVLEISTDDQALVTAVGTLPMTFEGERVTLVGRWCYHKEFGRQFAFESYEKSLPEEVDGILQYLSSRSVKGVGPVTALKIVNRYGKDTFDVIENHPEWLADIPGITMKKAAQISESFREQTGIREVMIFCRDYLGTGEITKVYKALGTGAVGILRDNPYILCTGDFSIGFEKADSFAKSLGVAPDWEERIYNGILYVLKQHGHLNGHTCLPVDMLVGSAATVLGLAEEKVRESLSDFVLRDKIAIYKTERESYAMTREVADAECYIAKKLSSLDGSVAAFSAYDVASLVEKVEVELGISFASLQRRAIIDSLASGVMILTGGPGTGKTTVVRAMLSLFESMGLKTVLAAPTGRAAKRMSEATSREAKTIHRMLEMEKNSVGVFKFMRNEKNPLDERVIIVDEASMIDLFLVDALLRAVRKGARLILIGDVDQLPSVGAGNLLCDLIASDRIRTVRLNEIFRQSEKSLIITNAHRINEGTCPILNVTDNDFFFVRRENEADIAKTVGDLICERLPRTYGEDIKDKIQVITPSKKGAGGIEILNTVLQERLNPKRQFKKERVAHGITFREGDKVMQTVNNYDIEWEKNGISGTGVFNGDIGIIDRIDLNDQYMDITFDDRVARYSFDKLEELDLAYAITVHKSQGSEYPVVIMPLYSCAPMLLSRNLFYTAVTRAKRMVILVGRGDIPERMVRNNREILRYTTLKARLCDYF
ncbi:MAG: ATP-dependent RecD-like DNA helicase [Clostridia bacterium]|nr:ATP-dependent RecD-like DNA helicase [Clostridia bacterium]